MVHYAASEIYTYKQLQELLLDNQRSKLSEAVKNIVLVGVILNDKTHDFLWG